VKNLYFTFTIGLIAAGCQTPTSGPHGPGVGRAVSGVGIDESWWRMAATPGTASDPVLWINAHPRQNHALELVVDPQQMAARRQALLGTPNWQINESQTINSTPAIYVAGSGLDNTVDRVIIEGAGSPAHYIGIVSNVYGASPTVTASPAIDSALDGTGILLSLDGTLAYVATSGGRVYAVKLSDGTFAWGPITLPAGVSWATPWLDYSSTPNALYIADTSGTVTKLDATTGGMLWQNNVTGGAAIHSSPILYNDILWLGADDGSLHRASPTSGNQIQSGTSLCMTAGACGTNDQIWSAPFIDSVANILLITVNKRLLQISIDPSTGCNSSSATCSFTPFSIDEGAFTSSPGIAYAGPYADTDNGFAFVSFDNRLWRASYTTTVSGGFTRASTISATGDPTGVMRPWSQTDHTHPKSSPLEFNGSIFLGDGSCAINRFDSNMTTFALSARQEYSNAAAVPTAVGPTIDSTPLIDILGGGNVYFSTTNPTPTSPPGSWVSLSQGYSTQTVSPGTAIKLWISATASVSGGSAFDLTVSAVDQFNRTATSYAGTVHFTSTDGAATLPANYTFNSTDKGAHTFPGGFTLRTSGARTITATDTINSSITTTWPITVNAGGTTHFQVTPSTTTPSDCTQFTVTVTAQDALNNTTTGYTGTVHFTSSDGSATLPGDYPFTAADAGVHTFNVTLRTPGSRTVTATDTATASITGFTTVAVNGAATHLAFSGLGATATAGTADGFSVQALDACNALVATYTGNVGITSSDAQATLPGNHTYNGADAGSHMFSVTFKTAGPQTLTASDGTLSVTSGTITVSAANSTNPTGFLVSGPAAVTANNPFSVTITAIDQFGNTVSGYVGTITFASNDNGATLPGAYTFTGADAGSHTFTNGVTLVKVSGNGMGQSTSVTVTGNMGCTNPPGCTTIGNVTGTANFTVAAQMLAGFTFGGLPNKAPVGLDLPFTVTAVDANGHTITAYTGTVSFTSTDPTAIITPSPYTYKNNDNGVASFTVNFNTAGQQTITVTGTDPVFGGTKMSTSKNVKVSDGIAATFDVAPSVTTTTSGTNFNVVVTGLDGDGNRATKYRGFAHFTSSDAAAQAYPTLPANYQFTGADKGLHTFANVELLTTGTQTITVTDTVNAAITGTSPGVMVSTGSIDHFAVTAPASAAADQLFTVTVTAKDKGSNTIMGYTGTLQFRPTTGMNPQGVYPADYTFLAGDNGMMTFTAGVSLHNSGTQTFFVRDQATTSAFGSAVVTISAGAASHYSLVPSTTTPTHGVAFTITVTALDAGGSVDTGYLGTVHFTSNDPAASLPSDYIFQAADNGTHIFTFTLNTTNNHTVTATDTVTPSITATTTLNVQ
jgi:hypothetical protein